MDICPLSIDRRSPVNEAEAIPCTGLTPEIVPGLECELPLGVCMADLRPKFPELG